MKFAHSYWTEPRSANYDYSVDLTYAALSVTFVHKNGHVIDLYTDTKGAKIFKDIPYDNVYVILDNFINEINPHIWSASKYKALEAMELGTFHIDYDFFLKDDTILGSLENIDMFCQNIIPNNSDYAFVSRYIKKACPDLVLPDGVHYEFSEHILHQGIFAVFNQKLKDEILEKYFYTAREVTRLFPPHLWDIKDFFVPNLLLEEKLVGEIAYKYRVKCLLDIYAEHYLDIQNPNPQCEHFAGNQKKYRIDYIRDQLKEQNPELYEKLVEPTQI